MVGAMRTMVEHTRLLMSNRAEHWIISHRVSGMTFPVESLGLQISYRISLLQISY